MQPTMPEPGKTYISNIPSAPHIAVRIKVETVQGIEARFIATCSFPDEPASPCIELAPEDWEASGFSLALGQTTS